MSTLSKLELETGVDLSDLDPEQRLLALRMMIDTCHQIAELSVNYSRDLQRPILRYMTKLPTSEQELAAAIANLESEATAVGQSYIQRVIDLFAAACNRLREYGLREGPKTSKH